MAACYYNLDRLIEARAGSEREAAVSYGRSLALRPNATVEARLRKALAGSSIARCTVSKVERTVETLTTHPGWKAAALAFAAGQFAADNPDALPPLADDAAAKAYLCGDEPCQVGRPAVVTVGTLAQDPYATVLHLVIPQRGGTLLASSRLAGATGGRCPSVSGAWVLSEDPLHVVSFESWNDWVFTDAAGRRCRAGDIGCASDCAWYRHTVRHRFLDPAAGRAVSISAVVTGISPSDAFPAPDALVQAERLGPDLVVYGCGSRFAFLP